MTTTRAYISSGEGTNETARDYPSRFFLRSDVRHLGLQSHVAICRLTEKRIAASP
jgi:hypothetical protein